MLDAVLREVWAGACAAAMGASGSTAKARFACNNTIAAATRIGLE
jgi:hypothetical protein